MLLSRLELNTTSAWEAASSRFFEHPYCVHQGVWRFFSKGEKRDRDFLYRIDRQAGRPLVFTLSERPPEDADGLWSITTKVFEPDLRVGDRLAFRLRANPTIRRKEAGAKAGERCDAVYDQRRQDKAAGVERTVQEVAQEVGERWLARKGGDHGFQLRHVAVDGYEVHRFAKKGVTLSVATCDFEGVLEVTDVAVFREALRSGIGSAKGFGCGLLLVKRA